MDCRTCKYHAPIPGDTHVSCHHPLVQTAWDNPLSGIYEMLGGIKLIPVAVVQEKTIELIQFDPEPSVQQWCGYPFNFDPVWLRVCIFRDFEAYKVAKNN